MNQLKNTYKTIKKFFHLHLSQVSELFLYEDSQAKRSFCRIELEGCLRLRFKLKTNFQNNLPLVSLTRNFTRSTLQPSSNIPCTVTAACQCATGCLTKPLHAGRPCAHPVSLLENHLEDLLREEEEVEASEDHRRLAHVEMLHRVKTKGLQHETRGQRQTTCPKPGQLILLSDTTRC